MNCFSFIYVFCHLFFLFGGCQHLPKVLNKEDSANTITLFDGSSLSNWKATDFAGKETFQLMKTEACFLKWVRSCPVSIGRVILCPSKITKFHCRQNELWGSDFFAVLLFLTSESHATLILGGWGGSLIGISSIDDFDASENETGDAFIFEEKPVV